MDRHRTRALPRILVRKAVNDDLPVPPFIELIAIVFMLLLFWSLPLCIRFLGINKAALMDGLLQLGGMGSSVVKVHCDNPPIYSFFRNGVIAVFDVISIGINIQVLSI